jgi:hypothetical protein
MLLVRNAASRHRYTPSRNLSAGAPWRYGPFGRYWALFLGGWHLPGLAGQTILSDMMVRVHASPAKQG